jgi:hypothetical protein
VLQYIREESSLKTSVSTDLSRSSLSTLSTLMLAQAQECVWYLTYVHGMPSFCFLAMKPMLPSTSFNWDLLAIIGHTWFTALGLSYSANFITPTSS